MKISVLLPYYAANLVVGLSSAITLPTKRDASSPAVVGFPMQRTGVSIPQKGLNRRGSARKLQRGVVNDPIQNKVAFYTTDVFVGTPPQKVTLRIDTGSSDFWMNEVSSSYCASPPGQTLCSQYGTYDSGSSTSRVPVQNSFFQITYLDGTGASGGFVKDTVTIGGQELTDFQFAEAYSSGVGLGTIGLGYGVSEQQQEGSSQYPTLPEAFLNKGLINLNAYSIWLDDLAAPSGTLLFGGIDKAKYAGKLTTWKVEQGPDRPELGVNVNSVSFKGATVIKPFKPLVDTGSESSYLPPEMVDIILTPLGAVYTAEGYGFVECGLATSTETIDFELGTDGNVVTIRVPLSSLIYPSPNIQAPKNAQGVDLCAIGIDKLSNSADEGALGDTFLRSAYVVMDLSHSEMSMAQAVHTTDSNIVEIPAAGVKALNA
ncbi:hypothetical protein MMC22_002170 [Lobaria immixta]|nr:hypothetical protein [Lobaria immixta]